jgi:phosphoglycerate dehydrogenase-like enzyme
MKAVIGTTIGKDFGQFVRELEDSFPGIDFQSAQTQEDQKAQIRDADIFVGVPTREVYLAAQKLRWIHNPGTGIDWIAGTPELIDSEVVLTNALGPHAPPMADHVFAMMLTFTHHLRDLWEDQRAHRWEPGKYDVAYEELAGRTMGILALGGIGMEVARRAYGFGMEVYAVDIRPMTTPPEVEEVWGLDRLDDLLRISDWFVVTVPLTPETRGLIGRERLELLKPSAYVIIISRGGIVDENALAEVLSAGRIAGAGIDAFEQEPLPSDSVFWDLGNVIISPHASALTPELWEGRRQVLRENLRRFVDNETLLYVCDKKAGF